MGKERLGVGRSAGEGGEGVTGCGEDPQPRGTPINNHSCTVTVTEKNYLSAGVSVMTYPALLPSLVEPQVTFLINERTTVTSFIMYNIE